MGGKILAMLVMVGLTGTAVAQEEGNTSQGADNGQPFQALSALIEENNQLIADNAGAIEAIAVEVAVLAGDIEVINQQMADLDTRLGANESAIANALAMIDENSVNIEGLESDLISLSDDTKQDIDSLRQDIRLLDQEVGSLLQTNSGRIASLLLALSVLSADVQDNTAAINPLITDISYLMSQVMFNTNSVSLLNNQRNLLVARIDDLDFLLLTLNDEIDKLKVGVVVVGGGTFTDIGINETISGALTIYDAISLGHPSRSNAYSDTYTFELGATRTVVIDLASPDINSTGRRGDPGFVDTLLVLHRGDCRNCRLTYNDDGGEGLNSRITMALDTGLYTIEVTSYKDEAVGEYQLRLQ